MNSIKFKKPKLPFVIGFLVFMLVFCLTQYLSYQQYLISKDKEHETLLHELSNVKDKLRNILYNDITAANTLVILYKEYGTPKNFDVIAQQIIQNSKYADAIQLTKGGIITNVYPLKGYESTIGINTLKDTIRQKEAKKAVLKKEIFFAGPRKLRQGGIGILGKVPIVVGNELKGFCVVLTKWQTLKKALGTHHSSKSPFYYTLSKKRSTENDVFKLTDTNLNRKSEVVSIDIPEGDWNLQVSYSTNYTLQSFPYELSIFGFFFAFVSGLATFRKLKEQNYLKKKITEKTHLLNERVKELSTIYNINNLLLNEEQDLEGVFNEIINILPLGWQFPEICEVKIIFDGTEYTSKGFQKSYNGQIAYFELLDQRKGSLEVIYTEEKPNETEGPFYTEERNLINSAAKIIETYLNKVIQKKALHQSEERFRLAFELASIGMATLSPEGKWLTVNKALCNMLGYSEEEFKKINFQEVTHPDDLKRNTNAHQELLEGKRDFYRTEKRYIHKNGSIVWTNLNVVIIRDENNQPKFFVTQIENITEKIESQAKFKDLVEKSPVSIYIAKDQKITYANPQMLKEYGYTEQEISNKPIQDFIFEEDLELIRKKTEERIRGFADNDRYEIRLKKKNGDFLWTEIFSFATIYEGTPAIIGTIINIDEQKKLQIEKLQIINDLTQRNRDLEQFSFIVSHNMRAPIANLLGLITLVETNDKSIKEDENKFIQESIKKSALVLNDVVSDVNEILSLKTDFSQSKVNLNFREIIEKIETELQNTIYKTKAQITCDFSAVETINSIAPYIHSIFLNLISNALKYRQADVDPIIKIWTEKKDDHIEIYFQDNGAGIDLKKYGNQIFGLYRRFDLSKEGKGMGLFMVKAQINSLEGDITVESKLGRGTTFKVTLPRN